MQSPLPDSSALEAGILEDQKAAAGSTIQNSVRALLRSSVLDIRHSSAVWGNEIHNLLYPRPELLTVPIHADAHPASELRTHSMGHTPGIPITQRRPPTLPALAMDYLPGRSPVPDSAHATPHVLCHPDLDDDGLALLVQRKTAHRQRHAWVRRRKTRYVSPHKLHSRVLASILSGVVLAAFLGTCL